MPENGQSENIGEETLLLIDPIRDRFDKAWQAALRGDSPPPCLEDYVAECETDEELRRYLLHLLIPIDIECRRKYGEIPLAHDYRTRFPALDGTWLENELKGQRDSAIEISQPMPLPRTFGKYTLETELGRGGFGSVFCAFDQETHCHVALKRLLAEWSNNAKYRESLSRELDNAKKLNHTNIVRVLDNGTVGNEIYIAYELIDGSDLARWLKHHSPTAREAVKMLLPIVDALHAAHRERLVHLDLKPQNILIDKSGKTFVTDFGLSATIRELVSGKSTGGTPRYAAPEQLFNRPHLVGERSDIFAIGVILYEMLSGRCHPYEYDDVPNDANYAQILKDRRSPRALRDCQTCVPDVTTTLERVCLKALSLDHHERFGSCLELAGDLRRAIGLPSFELEGPDAMLQEKLSEIPPGPGLNAYQILGPDFYGQVARLIPNYDDVVATVRCAGELVRRVNPRKTIVEDIHLPSSDKTISQVWSGILAAVCVQGPQMLAAFLLVLPTRLMPSELVEKRDSLWERLRNPPKDEEIEQF